MIGLDSTYPSLSIFKNLSGEVDNTASLIPFELFIIIPPKGDCNLLLILEYILKELDNFFKFKSNNKKLRAVVTAGPTQEYIDPVRYISNRSSGKQGYEIAKSLFNYGFDTTLISGPSKLTPDPNINLLKVNTAEEMYQKTIENLPCDVAIFCAAVGDFKVKNLIEDKIKKDKDLSLDFEKNIDSFNCLNLNNQLAFELFFMRHVTGTPNFFAIASIKGKKITASPIPIRFWTTRIFILIKLYSTIY